MRLILYRAMSEKEFTILKDKGFRAIFGKGVKWFATDPEYVYIVMNEVGYNEAPEIKYVRVVRFELELNEMARQWILDKVEREYLNIGMHCHVLRYLKSVKWTELSKNELPEPKPIMIWKSRSGRIVKLYSIKKAMKMLRQMKSGKNRILYVADVLSKIEKHK